MSDDLARALAFALFQRRMIGSGMTAEELREMFDEYISMRGEKAWPDAFSDARAALAAIEAQGYTIELGWQPIETAPRDCSPFILAVKDRIDDIWRLYKVRFYQRYEEDCEGYWALAEDHNHPFIFANAGGRMRWRPLPSAPKVTE